MACHFGWWRGTAFDCIATDGPGEEGSGGDECTAEAKKALSHVWAR
jgi:hypothetical protein